MGSEIHGLTPKAIDPEDVAPAKENPLLAPLNTLLSKAVQEQVEDRVRADEGRGMGDHHVRCEAGEVGMDAWLRPDGVEVRKTRPNDRETARIVKKIEKAIIKGDVNKLNTILTQHPSAVNGSSRHILFPIEMANCHYKPEVARALVQVILNHNPDLSVCDRHGNNVFHRASIGGHKQFAEELLHHSGGGHEYLSMTNDRGEEPWEYARTLGCEALVNLYSPVRAPSAPRDEARPAPALEEGFAPILPEPPWAFQAGERPGEEEGFLHNVRRLPNAKEYEHPLGDADEMVEPHQVMTAFAVLMPSLGPNVGRLDFGQGRGFINVNDRESGEGDLSMLKSLFDEKGHPRFFFVPVSLSDGRVASMICDRQEEVIELFDPCGNPDKEVNKRGWERFLNLLDGRFQDSDVSIVKTLNNKFSPFPNHSGIYSLLYAQCRLERQELGATEMRRHLRQLAKEARANPAREEARIKRYRKQVFGPALGLGMRLDSVSNELKNSLPITPVEREQAERNFQMRFPYTHHSERLILACQGLTTYDWYNQTDNFHQVMNQEGPALVGEELVIQMVKPAVVEVKPPKSVGEPLSDGNGKERVDH